jgi:Domain of unknown function (DUF4389)
MTEDQKLIAFIDDYLKKNSLDGVNAAEASRLLDQAGLLTDDASRPGEPLRKLMREGHFPHAHKVQNKWFIPLSLGAAATELAAVAEMEPLSRMKILLRLLYSLLFLLVFEVVRLVLQLTVLSEYVFLLIKGKPSKRLRVFGARISDYTYHLLRYLTLNENGRPYPFSKFPSEVNPPERHAKFD